MGDATLRIPVLGEVWALLAGSLLCGSALVGAGALHYAHPSKAASATLFVEVGSSGNCTSKVRACGSIKTAITAAESGAFNGDHVNIEVGAGTYRDNQTVSCASLNSLTIVGAGAGVTIVNGNRAGAVFAIDIGAVDSRG